jgi:DNA-binding CsgD family transcriptional regulator
MARAQRASAETRASRVDARRNAIAEILRLDPLTPRPPLAARFGISVSTLQNDITSMTREGEAFTRGEVSPNRIAQLLDLLEPYAGQRIRPTRAEIAAQTGINITTLKHLLTRLYAARPDLRALPGNPPRPVQKDLTA